MPVKQSPAEQLDTVSVLHALADPVRLEMVRQLFECGDEKRCGEIEVPVTKSTATHHLKVLCAAGITTERAQGTRKFIKLRCAELDERFPGLLESVLTG